MADVKKKQLAFNIIEFLRSASQDGTIKEDDKESLEVAISCIGESFGVDPDSEAEKSQYSLAPASLLSLLDVYLKTKAKSGPTAAAGPTSAPAAATSSPAPSSSGPSAADKTKAEALKTTGNSQMSQKLYDSAITSYTEAISLAPNPVYFSNRAAAWGALGEHGKAADDAQRAIDLDPNFVKGYSRLGHARFSLGEWDAAVQAYEDGLAIEPGNANIKQSLATARAKADEEAAKSEPGPSKQAASSRGAASGGAGGGAGGGGGMPDLSALAGLMGGGGGRGGGGGMPDLASLMNNPQMMQMAQQMMANGGLDRLMSNPNVRRMAEQYQAGGGMPDMSQLANDPEMRNLAQSFMGGGAGGGAGRGR